MRRKNKAQTLLEYAVLIGVVVGSLIAMGIFFTRAFQAKFRQSADVFGEGEQYEKPEICDNCLYASLDASGKDMPQPEEEPRNDCASRKRRIEAGEREVVELGNRAADFETRAAEIEAQAQILINQGLNSQAEAILKNSQDLRQQAQITREKADAKEAQLNQEKKDYDLLCVPAG